MFMHNKRAVYTVRVSAPDSKLANLILEQFGGADGPQRRRHARPLEPGRAVGFRGGSRTAGRRWRRGRPGQRL